ncbi:hypothetical protein HNP52_003691 [Sphingomonas kyeonggiensis]|uniref:OmpA-like domain-containing protein n=1 Tax=Sphingomonas kyeonggiensis TaxID=1268553 RepID=A0A7W7K3Y2_9SPHN|nr:OmpA family protein [Sphingomonas kyeonggiensis]MBB4840599.1 hypothetical protein [Sphingomonas kyeonggiensis]
MRAILLPALLLMMPGQTVSRSWVVFLEPNSRTLPDYTGQTMAEIRNALKANPNAWLRISGHTDRVGTEAANMVKSRNMANIVEGSLKVGFDPSRFKVFAYGESRPSVMTKDGVREIMNQRVVVELMTSPMPVVKLAPPIAGRQPPPSAASRPKAVTGLGKEQRLALAQKCFSVVGLGGTQYSWGNRDMGSVYDTRLVYRPGGVCGNRAKLVAVLGWQGVFGGCDTKYERTYINKEFFGGSKATEQAYSADHVNCIAAVDVIELH